MNDMQINNVKYAALDEHQEPPFKKIRLYFDDQSSAEFYERTFKPIIRFAGFGACMGSLGGLAVAGPGGIIPGAFYGGSSGLLIGLGASGIIHYQEYDKWLHLFKETKVFEEFEQLHRDHPALEEFKDPIMYCLMFDPVRSPFGHLFERSTLKNIERPNGTISDPYRNGDFSMHQVEDAPEVLAKLKAVYKELLRRELETDISESVRRGLQAMVDDLEKQVKNYEATELTTLLGKFKLGQITFNDYKQKINELHERLNPQVVIPEAAHPQANNQQAEHNQQLDNLEFIEMPTRQEQKTINKRRKQPKRGCNIPLNAMSSIARKNL